MHPTDGDLKPKSEPHPDGVRAQQQTLLVVGGLTLAVVVIAMAAFRNDGSTAIDPVAKSSLDRLAASKPGRRFELVRGGTAEFGRTLSDLRVERVELSDSDPVRVTVHYTSVQSRDVKPKLNVSLYDRDGELLADGAVVDHIFADLEPGESSSTSDELAKKRSAKVAIVGVDDHNPLAEAQSKREREDAAQRAIDAEEEKVRGPKPQASDWDGITPEANAYLKRKLKDYKSMELVECSVVVPFGDDKWAQRVRYRSKNSFGAYVVEELVFVIRDGVVLVAVPNSD